MGKQRTKKLLCVRVYRSELLAPGRESFPYHILCSTGIDFGRYWSSLILYVHDVDRKEGLKTELTFEAKNTSKSSNQERVYIAVFSSHYFSIIFLPPEVVI